MSDITSEYLCIIASYFIHLCTAHTTQYIRGYVEPARGLLCVLVYSLLVYLFYTLWQHSVQCARCLPIDTVYTIFVWFKLYCIVYRMSCGSFLAVRYYETVCFRHIQLYIQIWIVLLFCCLWILYVHATTQIIFFLFVQKLDGINSKVYGVDWNQSFWCVYNVRFLCKCVQCALRYTVIRWWILYFFACFLATNCYNTSGDKFSRLWQKRTKFYSVSIGWHLVFSWIDTQQLNI